MASDVRTACTDAGSVWYGAPIRSAATAAPTLGSAFPSHNEALGLRGVAVKGIPALVNRLGCRPRRLNEGDDQVAMVAAASPLTFDEDRT